MMDDLLASPVLKQVLCAMAHTVAEDEILKNTFANNAFENFEIAARPHWRPISAKKKAWRSGSARMLRK